MKIEDWGNKNIIFGRWLENTSYDTNLVTLSALQRQQQ
jgi:hypothetical protein